MLPARGVFKGRLDRAYAAQAAANALVSSACNVSCAASRSKWESSDPSPSSSWEEEECRLPC